MVDMRANETKVDPGVDYVALPPGQKIGRYEVLSVLGQGGFGITYRARDVQLGREVAIKEYLPTSLAVRHDGITVLPRSTKVAEDFNWGRERFVAEGRTMATLHRAPGIVKVFDFLEVNGTAYIVMEMLHGDTLEAHIKKKGPMGPEAIDRIVWPLLDGLEQVHGAGFLHRDIKPANILLDAKGNPTLIDFGAARASMVGRTVAMTAIFTPGYAAAEQFTSAKQGPWTDIYGLAATLYHGITGTSPPSAFDRMLDDEYIPAAKRAPPGYPAGLLAGIDAGLAVRSSERPQSIAGWRPILSLTAAPAADATALADVDATMVARPAAPAARRPATQPSARVEPPPSAAQVPEAVPAPAPAAGPARPSVARSNKALLYGGVAAIVLALGGGSAYFALAPKAPPAGASLQDLKVEDLERALAERRKADADAAEKQRLEQEAQKKAASDAAAKVAADAEVVKAEAARQKAEAELAQLKAQLEASKKATAEQQELAEAKVRREAAEAAQRKAEAEMAALKQAEDDARKKAAADAETKRQADEALVKAQADRAKAEADAQAKADAEARQKAEANGRQIAEAQAREQAAAEAKAKAEFEAAKKAAEAAEIALRLGPVDRQRAQVALTALGFNTNGTDGVFGTHTHDMIGAWQKSRSYQATGYLTAPQNQELLQAAAAAVAKFDADQKKIEEDKKKAEEDAKKKADEEAKAKAATAAPPPQAPASGGLAAFDGVYSGSYGTPGGPRTGSIQVTNGKGNGSALNPYCGPTPISITISNDGSITGSMGGFADQVCTKDTFKLSGSVSGNKLQMNAVSTTRPTRFGITLSR